MSYAPIKVPEAFTVASFADLPDSREHSAPEIRSTWSVNTNTASLVVAEENSQLSRCSTLIIAQIFSLFCQAGIYVNMCCL